MKPLIFGLEGISLSDKEKEFFKTHQPYGFILFKRNCETREQILSLTSQLRDLFPNREEVKIFIDQEGGRVARIKPPIASTEYPTASSFGKIENLEEAKNAVFNNYASLMRELVDLGINATCAPVVDLFFEDASDVIGDRSFGSDPARVAELAIASLEGIESAGGDGVIKHIPGHGRAMCDSHLDLPVVTNSLDELEATDFKAFRMMADTATYAMTAHIIYQALDKENPATLSKIVIDYIRHEIGFLGSIMTDDLSMKALKMTLSESTKLALNAGCNLILHCNGNMEEMKEIANSCDEYYASKILGRDNEEIV